MSLPKSAKYLVVTEKIERAIRHLKTKSYIEIGDLEAIINLLDETASLLKDMDGVE